MFYFQSRNAGRLIFSICALCSLWWLQTPAGADEFGRVDRVDGELAYISGLNGSAPLWSVLHVVRENGEDGPELDVIKVLDREVIASVGSGHDAAVRKNDRVAFVREAHERTAMVPL